MTIRGVLLFVAVLSITAHAQAKNGVGPGDRNPHYRAGFEAGYQEACELADGTFAKESGVVSCTLDGGGGGGGDGVGADALGNGPYCSNDWCYQSDQTFFGDSEPTVLVLFAFPGGAPTTIPLDTDETYSVSAAISGFFAYTLYFEGNSYRVTNLPEVCYADPFQCDFSSRLSTATNQSVLEQAIQQGQLTIGPDPELAVTDEFSLVGPVATYRIAPVGDFGITAGSIELLSTEAVITRVEEGTGNQGEGLNCAELNLSPIWSATGQARVVGDEKVPNGSLSANVFDFSTAGNGVICSDTPAGDYTINLTALDGYGGKEGIGAITVRILEATTPGGNVDFAP